MLVLGVALKAAQLPFHGWLIQVMEAPTPVSALLHAGVVNIGGLVMIRLAPLMSHAPFAQTLLIVIGMTTAIIASLVMTTRVSVKVSLAWSTCAQMGFMLVQCGLGAWHLALLHLVAHSLYKAHAFLSSGGAVESWRTNALVKPRPQPSPLRVALFATLALAGVGAWFWVTQTLVAEFDPTLAAWIAILGLSLVPTLAGPTTGVEVVWVAGKSIGIVALYFVWHAAFARALPTLSVPHESALAWVMVVLGFGLLLAIQTLLQARPASPLSTTLRPLLFAGLHLDEIITRALFRIWPPPMKRRGMTPVMRVMKGSEVLP